ncbi:hypothetical protein B4U79_06908 [Dinothrombium tinctorium]|uniref:Gamma-interferon-inducible lysosomal thiol reductase-like protein n=1 Tax=Dinothrombium tinctorium TaxID=1965070 RepID=A0A3S3QV35_9ACAR|nr:hypothetical protein B4U79_06908 [Dinothrombium tinctorium]
MIKPEHKVNVSVFYETYCPYSRQFLKKQLYPTYVAVGEIMNIELVPYGNAQHHELKNGTIQFKCQHGPSECVANMIHACAINLVKDMKSIMPFVNCVESQDDPASSAKLCCEKVGIDFDQIDRCYNSEQGQEFLLAQALKTDKFKNEINNNGVPFIIVDSVSQKEEKR